MHVLYVAPTNFPNDRAHSVQIAHTCHALAKLGVDVCLHVDVMTRPSVDACMDFFALDVPDTLSIRAIGNPARPGRLKRLDQFLFNTRFKQVCRAARGQDDVFVYTRGARGAELLRRLPREPGWPRLILEAHKLLFVDAQDRSKPRKKVRQIRGLEANVFGKVHGIASISDGVAREIVQEFNPTCPMRVIRSGVTVPPHRPTSAARDIDIIYCGQLRPWKGVDTLIRAMQWLPKHRLTVVGGHNQGDRARTRKLAVELGLSGRIDFVGYAPWKQVWEYLERAKVGVLPTPGGFSAVCDRYTSPMKLFEYMMCGMPVVGSDLPSIREVLQDGVTGKLVRPNHPRALADALLSLLNDEPLVRRMGERARQYAQQFNWQDRARQIIELLNCARESE